jgi:nucleoside-diphosphate-sugar epimerase
MRVFVTGATGFIGFAVVKALLAAGHEVVGLARSDTSATKLRDTGARAVIGSVENVALLREVASASDAAVHTAYYHQLSHLPMTTRLRVMIGGAPNRLVQRFFAAAVAADRRAIQALGSALTGRDTALAAAFGTLAMREGVLATEDDPFDKASHLTAVRASNEDVLKSFAERGVRTSAIRLPPIVHGPGAYGLANLAFKSAQKRRRSAYVGDGLNVWPSVHRDDAATAFQRAIEIGEGGRAYHAVAEQGVTMRDIAGAIGQRLNVPVVSIKPEEAARHFGPIAALVGRDNPTSSQLTRNRLGWSPAGIGLLDDLLAAELPDVRR